MFWSNVETETKKNPEVRLEDVVPQHPDEYPAKNLKARLAARRMELWEMRSHHGTESLEYPC